MENINRICSSVDFIEKNDSGNIDQESHREFDPFAILVDSN